MAAGPRTIARQFVERLSRIQSELSQIRFALGHAPGCDLFDQARWRAMYRGLEEVLKRLDPILEAAKAEAEHADEGTYEEIVQRRDSLEGAVEERLRELERPRRPGASSQQTFGMGGPGRHGDAGLEREGDPGDLPVA